MMLEELENPRVRLSRHKYRLCSSDSKLGTSMHAAWISSFLYPHERFQNILQVVALSILINDLTSVL